MIVNTDYADNIARDVSNIKMIVAIRKKNSLVPMSLSLSFLLLLLVYYSVFVAVSLLFSLRISPRVGWTMRDLLDTARERCENPVGSRTVTGHISRTCRPLFNHRLSPSYYSPTDLPSMSPGTGVEWDSSIPVQLQLYTHAAPTPVVAVT